MSLPSKFLVASLVIIYFGTWSSTYWEDDQVLPIGLIISEDQYRLKWEMWDKMEDGPIKSGRWMLKKILGETIIKSLFKNGFIKNLVFDRTRRLHHCCTCLSLTLLICLYYCCLPLLPSSFVCCIGGNIKKVNRKGNKLFFKAVISILHWML